MDAVRNSRSMEIAMQNNYYSPLDDLAYEDFDEEYLALGLECYFGLWAHDPMRRGYSGDNEYAFNTELLMAQEILIYITFLKVW